MCEFCLQSVPWNRKHTPLYVTVIRFKPVTRDLPMEEWPFFNKEGQVLENAFRRYLPEDVLSFLRKDNLSLGSEVTVYADEFKMPPFQVSAAVPIFGLPAIMQMIKINARQKCMSAFLSDKSAVKCHYQIRACSIMRNKINITVLCAVTHTHGHGHRHTHMVWGERFQIPALTKRVVNDCHL